MSRALARAFLAVLPLAAALALAVFCVGRAEADPADLDAVQRYLGLLHHDEVEWASNRAMLQTGFDVCDALNAGHSEDEEVIALSTVGGGPLTPIQAQSVVEDAHYALCHSAP